MFLAWFDPNKHFSAQKKLMDAVARWEAKWNTPVRVAIVSPGQLDEINIEACSFEVRAEHRIGMNVFWVGEDDAD